jgi:hypothetical protein
MIIIAVFRITSYELNISNCSYYIAKCFRNMSIRLSFVPNSFKYVRLHHLNQMHLILRMKLTTPGWRKQIRFE